ncbi:hypothetical protein FCV25MIE_00935 [Fagus crenata]
MVADETRQSQHYGSEGSLNSPGVMAFFDSETMPADTTLLPIGPSNDMGPIPLTVPMNGSVPTQGRVSKWKKAARNTIIANASPNPSKLSLNKKRRAEVEQGEDLNLDNPHVKRRLNKPSEDPDHLSIPAMVQEAAQYAAFAASASEEEPIYSNPAPQRWKPPAYSRSKINFAIIPCKQTSSVGFGLII